MSRHDSSVGCLFWMGVLTMAAGAGFLWGWGPALLGFGALMIALFFAVALS